MGTISELRSKIDAGISKGLEQFVKKYEKDVEKYAYKAEEQYYHDYSSWYDPYRHYDLMYMHKITSSTSARHCQIKINFSSEHMNGGHGLWAPLSNYAEDPGQVFEWGFETGNHGWYVKGTPIRKYWEVYFKNLETRAPSWANKYISRGLHSVGL